MAARDDRGGPCLDRHPAASAPPKGREQFIEPGNRAFAILHFGDQPTAMRLERDEQIATTSDDGNVCWRHAELAQVADQHSRFQLIRFVVAIATRRIHASGQQHSHLVVVAQRRNRQARPARKLADGEFAVVWLLHDIQTDIDSRLAYHSEIIDPPAA